MSTDLSPHPVDHYVGNRLKLRRKKLQISQLDLAERLNLSHQQIQKYEQGVTRISASMLFELGTTLGVPASYFFEGFDPNEYNYNSPGQEDIISPDGKHELDILLVEDDPADEMLTRKALDHCDRPLRIYSVNDGIEALNRLKTPGHFPRPDIILLDLNIPKKNGMDVLKDIKKDHHLRYIPVIILTNSINAKEMHDTYRLYASGYICKSFDLNIFRKNIANVVEYWGSTVVLPTAHKADIAEA